jgi:hypothetical protein
LAFVDFVNKKLVDLLFLLDAILTSEDPKVFLFLG